MKVLVSCCADCPFKRVSSEVRCKLSDLLLLGSEPGDVDYVSGKGIHPNCRLLTERAVVVLDQKTRRGATGVFEAFIGNRVMLEDGRRGIVVSKYKNAEAAGVGEAAMRRLAKKHLDGRWYMLLLDGSQMTMTPEACVTDIIKEKGDYNFNPDFEFYFGFGEADDEK